MNSIIWWILFTSAILVFIAGATFYIINLKKIRRLKNTYNDALKTMAEDKNFNNINDVLQRENHGELLWDFIDQEKKIGTRIADTKIIEFAINTIIRNNYKNVLVIQDSHGCIGINLQHKLKSVNVFEGFGNNKEVTLNNSKKYNVKMIFENDDVNMKYDFIFIQGSKLDIKNLFITSFSKLNEDALIFIDESESKIKEENKKLKELKIYLKLTKIRHEIKKYANGVLIIAK